MFTVPLIKIKLLTVLSMVFMGLFSRLVLGFPLILQSSSPTLLGSHPSHQFSDSGSRTSLRFVPSPRYTQKRRRYRTDGKSTEDEFILQVNQGEHPDLDFAGEILDYEENMHVERILPKS